jgi:hypothetical protein
VKVRTPPDPVTGQRMMELDRLELIRRLCTQIPAPRQHLVRYYGWYSNDTALRDIQAVVESGIFVQT